jgi:hypothetical protein
MGFGMKLGTNQACFETNINVGFWGNIQLSKVALGATPNNL